MLQEAPRWAMIDFVWETLLSSLVWLLIIDPLSIIFSVMAMFQPIIFQPIFTWWFRVVTHYLLLQLCSNNYNKLMVNCWFGLVVWIPGIPLFSRDWDSWVYPDSNPKPPNAPNQQLTISWYNRTPLDLEPPLPGADFLLLSPTIEQTN